MKSLWFKSSSVAALAICALNGVSQADSTSTSTTPLSGTSSTQAKIEKKEAAPLPITISDYSMIVGPALKDPTDPKSADDAIDAVQPMSSRQFLGGRYLINDKLSIGPVADFTYNFNTIPGAEKGLTWNDSFITFRDSNALTTKVGNNDLSADVWLNYYAPTSHGSNHNSAIGQFALWVNPTFQFHNSRWSLSAYSFAKYYANVTRTTDVDSNSPLKRWTFYGGPEVNYQLTDSVMLFVLYEANLRLYTDGLTDADKNGSRSLTDLEPGLMWNVSKNITLFPYLNWFLNQPVDTAALGLNASFKFL